MTVKHNNKLKYTFTNIFHAHNIVPPTITNHKAAASNRSNSDGSFLIRIRGLPFTTTKQEILDFFEGINIVSGEDGIHLAAFGLHSTKPLGEAYIELASEDDYEKAQDFHKKTMGSRYIEGTLLVFCEN